MEVAIVWLIGVIVGYILAVTLKRGKSAGTLKIDSSDPEGPYLFLELSKDVDIIRGEQYVTFRVDDSNYPRK